MKRKFAEAMDELQEYYIMESVAPGRRHSTVLRLIALAACLAVMAAVGFGLVNFNKSQEPEVILAPNRVGESQVSSPLERLHTIHSGFLEAQTVAWIRVGNWLGEDHTLGLTGSTWFELEVLHSFKGELPEKIVVKQAGCSLSTEKGFPLFIHGEEMILFLAELPDDAYENSYWIIGDYSTVLDVGRDAEGNSYVVDNMALLLSRSAEAADVWVQDAAVRKAVFESLREMDPLWMTEGVLPDWVVLKIEDFAELMKQ